MSTEPQEPGAKRRVIFVEELSQQVARLEELNTGLAGTVDELHAVLTELVEACESGSTSRYIEALGCARRLLDELKAVPHQRQAEEAEARSGTDKDPDAATCELRDGHKWALESHRSDSERVPHPWHAPARQ